MTSNSNHTSVWPCVSGIFMFLVLAWLTVSLPFVTDAQQTAKTEKTGAQGKSDDNPFANTTEEKTPSQTNLSEEYLHHGDHDFSLMPFQIPAAYLLAHESVYKSYHGEPPCPPPNFLS